MHTERTVKSDKLYQGKIINLRIDTVELPNQKYSKREIIEHSGGVAILAFHEDRILFVKQYRKAVEKILWELPAGKLEASEDPLDCAARELAEETGYEAGRLEYLFSFYTSPGFSNELIHLYKADVLEFKGASPDEDEDIEVAGLTLEEALEMVKEGVILDAKTILGLLYFASSRA